MRNSQLNELLRYAKLLIKKVDAVERYFKVLKLNSSIGEQHSKKIEGGFHTTETDYEIKENKNE